MSKWKISSEQESTRTMLKYLIGLLDEKGKQALHVCLIVFFFSLIVDLLKEFPDKSLGRAKTAAGQ